MQDKTTLGISGTFRQFIEALVEEVVINGEPFDAQKKWLRKYSEAEGVDHEALERNLNDFIDIIREWHELHTKSSEMMARMLAKECHLSDTALQALFNQAPKKAGTGANDHDYVDLGLPSGTLWATCNIGATKPEEYGDYFAWGETDTKRIYDENTYKYANCSLYKLTKYCNKSDYGNNGFTDCLTELQRVDDPAAANWGGGWQTPSSEQWEELLENTTHEWTTQNGVKGCLFTSKKNGETLFLPAAGCRRNSSLLEAGSNGYYWSSSLDTGYPSGARGFYFGSGSYYVSGNFRYHGQSVRPVRSGQN